MAEFTSYGRQDLFETTLASPINASVTSIVVQNTVAFTLSSGTLYAVIDPEGTTPEVVQVSAISSTTWTVTRGIALAEGGPSSAAEHAGGVKVIFSNNWKTYSDIATAIASKMNKSGGTFTGAVDFSGASATFRLPNLTTTQRDALTPADGMKIYNTTTGTEQVYDGGAWADNSTGTTPNGSETVAGSFELATTAEQGSATSTGATGARLVPANSNLVKTSSGAGDENKIALLGSDGGYAEGFLTKAVLKSTATTKGDIYAATGSGAISRLGVGANGLSPVADSAEATGIKWAPVNKTVAVFGTPATLTNSTTETTVMSGTVPAGAIGSAGGVFGRVHISAIGMTGTATLFVRLKYGATTVATLNIASDTTWSVANGTIGEIDFHLLSNSSASAQVAFVKAVFGAQVLEIGDAGEDYHMTTTGSSSEDSSSSKTLSMTMEWSAASATNTVTWHSGFAHTL